LSILGLGASFDVLTSIIPVDLADGDSTGHRIHMENYGGVAFVGYIAVGTAAQAPTFILQEHDAATSGNSQDLDVVAEYHEKTELELDGDEAWATTAQTADSDVTDPTWDDAGQSLVVFQVRAEQLTDTFEWVSVNVADPGTAQLGCVLAIGFDLKIKRAPANLAQPNL
jgi:pyruvate carboxylase